MSVNAVGRESVSEIMSVQFGKCNLDGSPMNPRELDQVRPLLARCCPDGEGSFCEANIAVVCRAFHTTKESPGEIQPHVLESGIVITWDGRLDNREELTLGLRGRVSSSATDVSIVAAAYERWEAGSFGRLIGDWALSVWDPRTRSLILAKDFIGTRHLYYFVEKGQVTWSTILDPLVLFAGHSFELDEEYVAGWLSFFPAPHLTPYRGIRSVPPSCFIQLTKESQKTCAYWDFNPAERIRYRRDSEYEEHFRVVFRQAVKRRLRSNSPLLAELSGGVDSSSIVCMADDITANEGGPRVDTVSYYDDSEPNWNERPYFTRIEEKRGRAGCHINIHSENHRNSLSNGVTVAWTPASTGTRGDAHLQFASCLTARGCRVVLSGIGGDEVLGGVPTAVPELADLLASARLRTLAHQLKAWALSMRKPWFRLFRDTVLLFFPPFAYSLPAQVQPAAWMNAAFVRRHQAALSGYRSRVKVFGPAPSLQENLFTLGGLRRNLACSVLPTEPPYEQRYPYLDRDLLEFLYAIPREQLIRPGQRRSLMRRALNGVVPDELLNRKRKAFVSRAPILAISAELTAIGARKEDLVISSLGVVDRDKLTTEMQKAKNGGEVAIVPLLRALTLESWMTSLIERQVFVGIGRGQR
jgi:asparagine synthase (glutamine-hydrolysing)